MAVVTTFSEREERADRLRRGVGLWLGPALFLAVLLSPTGLPDAPHRMAAVMALVMTWWITEPVPLPVTALLGPALAVLLGVARVRDAFSPFGDPVIFLFLGSFLVAEALRVHGLDRRIALAVLGVRSVSRSPARIRIAVALVTAAISMWISNTATAAMMLPIALGLVRALAAAGSRESPRGILLLLAIGASLGGMATPVGSPPNLIALGFLERAGHPLDFLRFMAIGVPLSLVLTAVTLVSVRGLVAQPAAGPADVTAWVARERGSLPRWGAGQWACAAAFAAAVTLWLLPGAVTALGADEGTWPRLVADRLEESVVALFAAAALFLWPVGRRRALTWEEAVRVDWGTLLLFGGGLSLGKMLFDTGLAGVVGRGVVEATGVTTLWGLTALVLATTIVLTELASNTATVSMLAPLVLALTQELGLPPHPPLLAACFGASMGFMFPVGTPPNAVVYGTGLIPITAMMRVGVVVDLLGFFVIFAMLRLLCPLLGMA
ncbi:MAG TPA: DASS family sodium-coupled anion symporter [Vicinamibacteria bacterium]|nr:DASS family sodium-coupled anion symporter [Vicinamibacteria bacterium]